MNADVTNHGYIRSKERLGFSKKTIERMAGKAFELGVRRKEVSGGFGRYLDALYLRHKNTSIRVYAEHVFVFGSKSPVLITVFPVPGRFKKLANKAGAKKP